ncbi:MAG: hypothetical protein A2W30_02885 [Ignavibacteria bacterium RBG_16_36_9]|nr:MAG: hypothetical protein A2W30_02885 [Ignavibacteria bacterium RBG_16_36_9]
MLFNYSDLLNNNLAIEQYFFINFQISLSNDSFGYLNYLIFRKSLMLVYFNNDFKLHSEVNLSLFDRGFLFADGVYESIRTYNNKLFRYKDHLDRLKRSLKETRIDFTELNEVIWNNKYLFEMSFFNYYVR